jgi:hypothetical protein
VVKAGIAQEQVGRKSSVDPMHPAAYRRNPFRVLGLAAGARRKDIERRAQLLRAGFELPRTDILLPLDTPPTPDEVTAAERVLSDPVQRFQWEFLWFSPLQPEAGEDQALGLVAQGDLDGSAQVWESESRSGDATIAGRAAHNLAVLYHFLALEGGPGDGPRPATDVGESWARSIRQWCRLVENEGFWRDFAARAEANGSSRLKDPFPQAFRSGVMPSVLELAAGLAVEASRRGSKSDAAAYRKVMEASGLPRQELEAAAVRALEPLRAWLKRTLEGAEKEAEANVRRTPAVALRLLDEARPAIDACELLLGSRHPVRMAVHDDVAARILSMTISYANEAKGWKVAITLLERAKTLAVGEAIRGRIAQNIEAAESYLDDGGVSSDDLGDTCHFCGKQAADQDAAVPVEMHQVTEIIPLPGGRTVKYRKSTVMVPRCSNCKQAHALGVTGDVYGCLVWFLVVAAAALLICTVGFAVSQDFSWPPMLGLFLPGTACLIWLPVYLIKSLTKRRKQFGAVKPLTAANDHPAVLGMRKEGWQLGEEP